MRTTVVIKAFRIFPMVALGIGLLGLVSAFALDLGDRRNDVIKASVQLLVCGLIGGLLAWRLASTNRRAAAAPTAPVDEEAFADLVESLRERFAGTPYLVESTGPTKVTVVADTADDSVQSRLAAGELDSVAGIEVIARTQDSVDAKLFRGKVKVIDGVAYRIDDREPATTNYTRTVKTKQKVGHTNVDTEMIYADNTDLLTPVREVLQAANWRLNPGPAVLDRSFLPVVGVGCVLAVFAFLSAALLVLSLFF